jgi:hypothetical protein
MSKRNRTVNKPNSQKKAIAPTSPKVDVGTAIENLHKAAIENATDSDLSQISNVEVPNEASSEDLVNLYRKAEEARIIFTELNTRLNEIRRLVEDEQTSLETEKQQLKEEEKELQPKLEYISEQTNKLTQWQLDLDAREINAKTGFLAQYQVTSEQAQSVFEDYAHKLTTLSKDLANTQLGAAQQLQTELEAMREKASLHFKNLQEAHEKYLAEQKRWIEEQQAELEQEREELVKQQRIAKRELSNLRVEQVLFEEDKSDVEKLVDERVAKNYSRLQDEREFLRGRLQDITKEKEQYLTALSTWQKIADKAGQKVTDATLIHEYITNLEQEKRSLQKQLLEMPSQQQIERWQDLQLNLEELQDKNFQLGRELSEAHRKLSIARQEVLRFEDLELEKQTLEASRDYMNDQYNQLRRQFDDLRNTGNQAESVFPRCFSMDQEFQSEYETRSVNNLQEFVVEVDRRISAAGLYYKERDIRSFVAGLNMSHLFILQGISGTGKTSLPIEFSKVIGSGSADERFQSYEVVEVQAGWRDRDDLLGYYNSFEHKFYEKKFLQALYKAGTPAFRDKIFIIVLDEMNLSYPEQYFADFLSLMERKNDTRWIDLIPKSVPGRPSPKKFDDGRRIRVPENVWFVGTANRDETTKDIADKTYDRSHIMELPEKHPDQNGPTPVLSDSPRPVSFKSLKEAFDRACKKTEYKHEIEEAWNFVESLRTSLANQLGVGWSNRLKSQTELYLPVIRASGGDWAEAVDDLLALKILRKMRDRYDIDPNHLEKLLETVEEKWNAVDTKIRNGQSVYKLERTFALIANEQSKKKRQNG